MRKPRANSTPYPSPRLCSRCASWFKQMYVSGARHARQGTDSSSHSSCPLGNQYFPVPSRVFSCAFLPSCSATHSLDLGLTRMQASQLQSRITLVWAVCSGILVVVAAAVFVSTLLRRPSRSFVAFLRGLTIFMSATSCIVGFAVMFPVIAECAGSGCSSKERALRLFVCGGVPVASVWTWVWIPTIRQFLHEL
ncbi:hypothetical protein B0H19DRAFT_35813 [Mycena capillaripes]|nr:hypothetical protein B0H19DRAFT_35813 [Mycena capillaripes]